MEPDTNPSADEEATHSRRIEDYRLKDEQEPDVLISFLVKVIHLSVRALAVLMTLIIVWGVVDAGWQIYVKISEPPVGFMTTNDILDVFGAFLAVLIAIEIFANITMYLRDDIIHVKLVIATALMAIARKVIVFDFSELTPLFVVGTGIVILALSVGYWLISVKIPHDPEEGSLQ